jgi:hypothetical protein
MTAGRVRRVFEPGDELDATRVHLNHHDVTLICF